MRFSLYVALSICACGSAWAQAAPAETTLRGCLVGGLTSFYIQVPGKDPYPLGGNVDGLAKNWGKEVVLQGILENSAGPQPVFKVTRIREVFPGPSPKLSPALANPSAWRISKDQNYGILYAHPASLSSVPETGPAVQTGLVAKDSAVPLGGFKIPRASYTPSNFGGGGFELFVNPEITNRPSCEQFGRTDINSPPAPQTVGGISYVEMTRYEGEDNSIADGYYYYHTFQNGLCYEAAFELIELRTEVVNANGCTIPEMDEPDRLKLIQPLLARVSFFRPVARTAPAGDSNSSAAPSVASFTASSQDAGQGDDRRPISFSWSAPGADYVELTYSCSDPDAKAGDVIIVEADEDRFCQNSTDFKDLSTDRFYRSPNSGVDILFGRRLRDPLSITVTLTPFSHAVPYPDAATSLIITVNP